MPKYIGKQYYPYKPYTFWRIKQIFDCDYHADIINVTGYKGTRFGRYNRYDVVDQETGKIILHDVTLEGLRIVLAIEDYPLKDNE